MFLLYYDRVKVVFIVSQTSLTDGCGVTNMTDILFVKNVPITVVQHGQDSRYLAYFTDLVK